MRRLFCGAAVAVLLGACSPPVSADAGVDAGPPTFAEMQMIFTNSCAVGSSACHNEPGRRVDLLLAAGSSHAQLVNRASSEVPSMRLVVPGDPAASYMMHKVDGTMSTLPACMAAGADCGRAMPDLVGGMLPQATRDRIRAWIMAGAPAQ
jgi:hypothetical protein